MHQVHIYKQCNTCTIVRTCNCFMFFCIDLVFDNGCRSPPWCQIGGDISYINVHMWDCEPFGITATLEGYYETKVVSMWIEVSYWLLYWWQGLTHDYDKGVVPNERIGDKYLRLPDLLKGKSQKFTKCFINEASFFKL